MAYGLDTFMHVVSMQYDGKDLCDILGYHFGRLYKRELYEALKKTDEHCETSAVVREAEANHRAMR